METEHVSLHFCPIEAFLLDILKCFRIRSRVIRGSSLPGLCLHWEQSQTSQCGRRKKNENVLKIHSKWAAFINNVSMLM